MTTEIAGSGGYHRAHVLEFVSDTVTPVQAFHTLRRQFSTGFLFESSEHGSKLARFSIIGIDPLEVVSVKESVATIIKRNADPVTTGVGNCFALLATRHGALSANFCDEGVPSFLPFTCGFAGYLGFAAATLPDRNRIASLDALQVPDMMMGFYDSSIVFDHLLRRIYVISFRGLEFAQKLLEHLKRPSMLPLIGMSDAPDLSIEQCFEGVSSSISKERFLETVVRCKDYVGEGQVFQIVLAQRFETNLSVDCLDVYRVLQAINPAPYGYFLDFPDFKYLGASPETLVQCKNGRASLRALAGTRPRGSTAQADQAIEQELRSDPKELAEHMMLVDLGRNDLGRIAVPGTVLTDEIASVVRYSNVMHLSTEITASVAQGTSGIDVLESCFPAGTVSGAPKIRAMQLLSSLEPEQRGIYSGMVGYINSNGDIDGAIAIRSALVKDGKAHVTAGAGIVHDSIPKNEYEETRAKASSVLRAIKIANADKTAETTEAGALCR